MALAALNTRLANRGSGMIGSAARRSANRNSTAKTTPATARPMMNGDVHGNEVPPRLVNSTRAVADGGDQRRAQVVDDPVDPAERPGQGDGGDHQGDGTDGHVDVEDPPPAEVVDEEAADQRTETEVTPNMAMNRPM